MSTSRAWYHHGVSHHSVGGRRGLLTCVRPSFSPGLAVDPVLLSKALFLAKSPSLAGHMIASLTCPWPGAGRDPCAMALRVYIPNSEALCPSRW